MEDRITIHQGDCLEVMRTLQAESVDAIVTDPPAGISFMGKDWDKSRGGRREWSQWLSERLRECWRVAKPGSHALVWALPRTSHWTACALEDAGWTIKDRVAHIFGTGFPKHKSKLKPAVEDWWLATKLGGEKWLGVDACRIANGEETLRVATGRRDGVVFNCANDGSLSKPQTNGSTAGRWPANLVLSHHPECKPNGTKKVKSSFLDHNCISENKNGIYGHCQPPHKSGHADRDGTETVQAFECHPECPIRILDEQSGELTSHAGQGVRSQSSDLFHPSEKNTLTTCFADSGGASRFFPGFLYCPKANRNDRGEGNIHPTVKAEPLMRWLVKLVTKPGGTVLDPFAGSGSTGFAAEAEGFHAILIEQEPEYVEIIKRRMTAFQEQTPLFK